MSFPCSVDIPQFESIPCLKKAPLKRFHLLKKEKGIIYCLLFKKQQILQGCFDNFFRFKDFQGMFIINVAYSNNMRQYNLGHATIVLDAFLSAFMQIRFFIFLKDFFI